MASAASASASPRRRTVLGLALLELLAVIALALSAAYALTVTDIALLQPTAELVFRTLSRGTTAGFPTGAFVSVYALPAALALAAALLAARGPVTSLRGRPLTPVRRALLVTLPLFASPLALTQDELTRRGAVLAVLCALAALAAGYLAFDPARGDAGTPALARGARAWLRAHWPVLLAIALHATLWSWVTITRDRAHWAGIVDLGLFKEALWNTLHGGGVMYSPTVGYSFLGEHFSPVLFLLLPFYAISPTSETLLIAQATAIALSAWPIYRIALAEGLGRALATALAAAMVFAPGVQAAMLYDFHMDLLGPPALAWAIWAAYAQRWRTLVISAVLLCSVKEDAFVALTGVSLMILLDPRATDEAHAQRRRFFTRTRKIGLVFGLAVVAYCVLAMFVFIKRFGPPPGVPEYMTDGTPVVGYKFFRNFSHLAGPGGPVRMLVGMPVRYALWALSGPRFTTICVLFGPLLFTPMFAGRRIVVLTTMAILLLSDNPDVTEMRYHYGAIQHPGLYAAAAFGMARWVGWAGTSHAPGLRRALACAVAAGAVVMAATHPGSLASVAYGRDFVRPSARTRALDALAARVPPQAPISATSVGGTAFSNRRAVRTFPNAVEQMLYAMVDLQRPSWPANVMQRDAAVVALLRSPAWGVVGFEQGAVLLARGHDRSRNREAAAALFVHRRWEVEGTEETDFPNALERDATASDGQARVVYPTDRHAGRFVVFGPGMRVPPGRWRATFRLRAQPTRFQGDIGTVDVFAGGTTLGDHVLVPEDFPTRGWHDVTVEFDSPGTAPTEFRIAYDHAAVLGADYIALDPVGADDAAVLNTLGL